MGKSGFTRTIAVIGCIALALTLVPLFTVQAPAAPLPWAKIADNGISPVPPALPVNFFTQPGVVFQDQLTVGDRDYGGIALPTPPVSMHTYDGNSFTQVGANGFNDLWNWEMFPTAVYGGELFIGTGKRSGFGDPNEGSQLWRWDGTVNPIPVPESTIPNGGWGEGGDCVRTVPLGEIGGQLVVCAWDWSIPRKGFRLFGYDGSNWTELAGPSATIARGLGYADNEGVLKFEDLIFNDSMILPIRNLNGLQVATYDGQTFTVIGKAGDPGLWLPAQVECCVAVSHLEGKVLSWNGDPTWSGRGR